MEKGILISPFLRDGGRFFAPLLGGAAAAIITPVDKIAERLGRKCSILIDAHSLITIRAADGSSHGLVFIHSG